MTAARTPDAGDPSMAGQAPASPAGAESIVVLPAPAAAPGPEPVGASSGQAMASARPESPDLQSCAHGQGGSTLYIQIYSETSRLAATALRQALQPEEGAPLLVAPIENVVRNAELRQQRPPVPWANPTLVLHDPASGDCARAIAAQVGAPWLNEAGISQVRLRGLPASLQAQPGVLELWLPPVDTMATNKKQSR